MAQRNRASDPVQLFVPSAHANAGVHALIMSDLKAFSAEQIGETAVAAGIYTKTGKLTAHYAPKKRKGSRAA
jgi:hypothetical protein